MIPALGIALGLLAGAVGLWWHGMDRTPHLIELPRDMALVYGQGEERWPHPGERGPGGSIYVRNRHWLPEDEDGSLTADRRLTVARRRETLRQALRARGEETAVIGGNRMMETIAVE